MDAVTGQFLDEDTQPGYPRVPPAHDPGWAACIVEMDEGDLTHLCSFPRKKKNYPLRSVAEGDLIAIQPCIRFGEWVAARVDQQIGWMNTTEVELVPFAAITEENSTSAAQSEQELDPAQTILSRMNATGRQRHRRDTIRLTRSEYNRINRFMRGIAVTLRMAGRRNERWDE